MVVHSTRMGLQHPRYRYYWCWLVGNTLGAYLTTVWKAISTRSTLKTSRTYPCLKMPQPRLSMVREPQVAVILVTTRSGKEGKTTVNYNNNFRLNSPLNMPKMLDSYSWALYMNAAQVNSVLAPGSPNKNWPILSALKPTPQCPRCSQTLPTHGNCGMIPTSCHWATPTG